MDGVNNMLQHWRHALEFKDFKLSKLKTKQLICGFSEGEEGGEEEVTVCGMAIPMVDKCRTIRTNLVYGVHCRD